MTAPATAPLSRLQTIGVVGFFAFLIAFGAQVEMRSALLSRRMGDLDVFLRAAWAVRNDADLYQIASDNDWHYIYPPLYAILLTPLADPPRGADPVRYLPYAISVAIFYVINLLCLLWGVHRLASALEERGEDVGFRTQPKYCLRWWLLRLWPILICFLPIGHTMMRGQANVIVLATLCFAMAGWIRGQSLRAGGWLALAICIKVFPAYLLVYPLWKRDGRALIGCAVGCFVGLVLIPVIAFGSFEKTAKHYDTYSKVFFAPFFGANEDPLHKLNKDEITGVNSTDSIGVKDAIHNWMYTEPGKKRPEEMHPAGKAAYLLLGFGMTFLTLWPRRDAMTGIAHAFAGLIVLMTIFSPVCHSHYLLFCVPVVMSLLANAWQFQETTRLAWSLRLAFAFFVVTMAVAYLPGLEILKDRCAALFATLPLWAIPVLQLWRRNVDQPSSMGSPNTGQTRLAA